MRGTALKLKTRKVRIDKAANETGTRNVEMSCTSCCYDRKKMLDSEIKADSEIEAGIRARWPTANSTFYTPCPPAKRKT
jgi:hypothetical protein